MMNSLANKALLVKLTRSMYQPYAFDQDATRMVEQATGVRGAGRYNKRLMKDCTPLKETNEAFNALYQQYMKNTVPWLDEGVRMLPNAIYFDFANDIRGMITAAKTAADSLAAQWDTLVAADIQRLGALAKSTDYPSADEVRAKFNAQIRFFPVPQSEDFRVAVSDEDKAEMEQAIAEATANVTKHLIKEMLAPVSKLAAKLAVPIGAEGSIFRDSAVENIMDEVVRAERLNINNDPEITDLTKTLRDAIAPYVAYPDTLRERDDKRAEVAKKMRELQDKMAWMVG